MVEEPNIAETPTGHKSESYREITPDAFWGYIRSGHIEATFFTTQLDTIGPMIGSKPKGPEFIAEINIKFTPQIAKQFTLWALERLVAYERIYGKIVLDQEVDPTNSSIPEDVKSKFEELLKTA